MHTEPWWSLLSQWSPLCYITSWPKPSKQVTCPRRGHCSRLELAGERFTGRCNEVRVGHGNKSWQVCLCPNSAPLAPSTVQNNMEGKVNLSVISMAKTQTHIEGLTSSPPQRNSSFYPTLSFLCLSLITLKYTSNWDTAIRDMVFFQICMLYFRINTSW